MSLNDIDDIKGQISEILEEENPDKPWPEVDKEYLRIASLIDQAVARIRAAYDGE